MYCRHTAAGGCQGKNKFMDSMIKAEELVYDYVRRDEETGKEEVIRAVDHLNLSIEPGSFVAVLGHNGSGKSTFAKEVNGILTPTEGVLYVDGIDTSDEEQIWEVRKTAGMVFQNPDNQIIGNIVEEDVGFGPENLGVPTEEIWERVDQALDAVEMTAYRKKSPNHLSGGQKQRVAIAGVLAMKPRCIVLDEPTAMLDPIGRREVIRTVHELNEKERITILLITHYMEEAIDADRVVVMDDGKLVMDGTPREIFSQVEKLKSYALDVPQVTELAWELRKAGVDLPEGILRRDELIGALLPLMKGDRENGD
jgi:energy-coupling factor transporter ATPase